MKVAFIENRFATFVWSEIARGLRASGHEIHWLVQNHEFTPAEDAWVVPYPSSSDFEPRPLTSAMDSIASSDRNLRHFEGDDRHYVYYVRRIREFLTTVKPDVVFGETTLFHELITCSMCRDLGIPYLAPNLTRYPAGRLVFCSYDTFDAVGGSGETFDDSTGARMLDDIRSRRSVPVYMISRERSLSFRLFQLGMQLRIFRARVRGEHFNTPTLQRYVALKATHRRYVRSWEHQASRRAMPPFPVGKPWVLYPLQMQPESNIDVFGQPWIDQAEIVARAARSLARIGALLVVKPNPKSKFELNRGLLDVVAANPNVVPLPHSAKMGPYFDAAPVVMSVTGTVILESIFAGKPVACLGTHALSRLPGVSQISTPEGVLQVLQDHANGVARRATREQALSVLNELNAQSYEAQIWDPFRMPETGSRENVARLVAAFEDVMRKLGRAQTRPETS